MVNSIAVNWKFHLYYTFKFIFKYGQGVRDTGRKLKLINSSYDIFWSNLTNKYHYSDMRVMANMLIEQVILNPY